MDDQNSNDNKHNEELKKAVLEGLDEVKTLLHETKEQIKVAGSQGIKATASGLLKLHYVRKIRRIKRLMIPLLVLLAGFYLIASRNPKAVAQVAVRGEAQLSVVANEIYLSLILSDYYLEQEAGSLDVTTYSTKGLELAVIETDAINRLTEAGLKPDQISLVTAGQNSLYDNQSRNSRSYNFRQYELKLDNFELADRLLKTALPYRVERFSIDRYSHSNLELLKIEAMALALDNARQKANRLAEGYGKIGGLIFVGDEQSSIRLFEGQPGVSPRMRKGSLPMAMAYSDDGGVNNTSPVISLKEFTLKASVDAIFAL